MSIRALTLRSPFLALLCVLTCGCQPSAGISIEATASQVTADDGSPLTVYRFDEKRRRDGAARRPRAVALYVQDSNDHPVTDAAGALAGLCAIDIPVFAVERRQRAAGDEACVGDTLAALRSATETASGAPIILLAAGDGSDVAAAAVPRAPGVTHVVLLGPAVGAADEVPKIDLPTLLVCGTADSGVERARSLRDAFARAGKRTLTYVEIPGATREFRDAASGRSMLPLVELEVLRFLARHGLLTREELAQFDRRVRKNHPEWFTSGNASRTGQ